jgi:hypothetical protein
MGTLSRLRMNRSLGMHRGRLTRSALAGCLVLVSMSARSDPPVYVPCPRRRPPSPTRNRPSPCSTSPPQADTTEYQIGFDTRQVDIQSYLKVDSSLGLDSLNLWENHYGELSDYLADMLAASRRKSVQMELSGQARQADSTAEAANRYELPGEDPRMGKATWPVQARPLPDGILHAATEGRLPLDQRPGGRRYGQQDAGLLPGTDPQHQPDGPDRTIRVHEPDLEPGGVRGHPEPGPAHQVRGPEAGGHRGRHPAGGGIRTDPARAARLQPDGILRGGLGRAGPAGQDEVRGRGPDPGGGVAERRTAETAHRARGHGERAAPDPRPRHGRGLRLLPDLPGAEELDRGSQPVEPHQPPEPGSGRTTTCTSGSSPRTSPPIQTGPSSPARRRPTTPMASPTTPRSRASTGGCFRPGRTISGKTACCA